MDTGCKKNQCPWCSTFTAMNKKETREKESSVLKKYIQEQVKLGVDGPIDY